MVVLGERWHLLELMAIALHQDLPQIARTMEIHQPGESRFAVVAAQNSLDIHLGLGVPLALAAVLIVVADDQLGERVIATVDVAHDGPELLAP